MVAAANHRAQHNANVAFQVARAEQVPFLPEEFDIVTAITVLCFVEDATPAFHEVARVLKPGGRLVTANSESGAWADRARGAIVLIPTVFCLAREQPG